MKKSLAQLGVNPFLRGTSETRRFRAPDLSLTNVFTTQHHRKNTKSFFSYLSTSLTATFIHEIDYFFGENY